MRHTVSGVERNNPGRPHSTVQKIAAIKMAIAEIPVDSPYSMGSAKFAVRISSSPKITVVQMSVFHSGETAKANNNGPMAAIHIPTYGTKRSRQVSTTPQQRVGQTDGEQRQSPTTVP